MTNEQVRQLIQSTDAANEPAAAAADPPPPPLESTAAKSSRSREQMTFLTYNQDGKQVDEKMYRGDT